MSVCPAAGSSQTRSSLGVHDTAEESLSTVELRSASSTLSAVTTQDAAAAVHSEDVPPLGFGDLHLSQRGL